MEVWKSLMPTICGCWISSSLQGFRFRFMPSWTYYGFIGLNSKRHRFRPWRIESWMKPTSLHGVWFSFKFSFTKTKNYFTHFNCGPHRDKIQKGTKFGHGESNGEDHRNWSPRVTRVAESRGPSCPWSGSTRSAVWERITPKHKLPDSVREYPFINDSLFTYQFTSYWYFSSVGYSVMIKLQGILRAWFFTLQTSQSLLISNCPMRRSRRNYRRWRCMLMSPKFSAR